MPVMIPIFESVIGREQALRTFSPFGISGIIRRVCKGRLLGISDIYIPYRLYEVAVQDRLSRTIRYLAVDAANGTLDPLEFEKPPGEQELSRKETRNVIPVHLNDEESAVGLMEKSRRLVYVAGFFRVSKPTITATKIGTTFYVPYWVGFYGYEANVKLIVLNGVRRTIEGSKLNAAVGAWLAKESGNDSISGPGEDVV